MRGLEEMYIPLDNPEGMRHHFPAHLEYIHALFLFKLEMLTGEYSRQSLQQWRAQETEGVGEEARED